MRAKPVKYITFVTLLLLITLVISREALATGISVHSKQTSSDTKYYFPIIMHNMMGNLYEKVFSIPVGEDGIRYYEGPGTSPYGPRALAILPDGSFVIGDLIDNRLLRYSPKGELIKTIDLDIVGINGVNDVVTRDEQLLVLEINLNVPLPVIYRVNVLSTDGQFINRYDIPGGLHLENGLSGIAVGGEGEILIELGGGEYIYQLVDAAGNYEVVRLDGYPYYGQVYTLDHQSGEFPYIHAGPVTVETRLTKGVGGLSLLGVPTDGIFFARRLDSGEMSIDITIHLMSAKGDQIGIAREPISERYVHVNHSLAVGPDGYVYNLIGRQETADVIRLFYVERMTPLNSFFIEPKVTKSQDDP